MIAAFSRKIKRIASIFCIYSLYFHFQFWLKHHLSRDSHKDFHRYILFLYFYQEIQVKLLIFLHLSDFRYCCLYYCFLAILDLLKIRCCLVLHQCLFFQVPYLPQFLNQNHHLNLLWHLWILIVNPLKNSWILKNFHCHHFHYLRILFYLFYGFFNIFLLQKILFLLFTFFFILIFGLLYFYFYFFNSDFIIN